MEHVLTQGSEFWVDISVQDWEPVAKPSNESEESQESQPPVADDVPAIHSQILAHSEQEDEGLNFEKDLEATFDAAVKENPSVPVANAPASSGLWRETPADSQSPVPVGSNSQGAVAGGNPSPRQLTPKEKTLRVLQAYEDWKCMFWPAFSKLDTAIFIY